MVVLTVSGLTAACADPVSPSRTPVVTLSFATTSSVGSAPALAAGAFSALGPLEDAGGRSLLIERVELVLRDVKLRRAEPLVDCDPAHALCERLKDGPVLVELPVSGGVVTPFSAPIPPGRYDRLDIRVKKPGDDARTLAFFTAHPEWPRRAAVRVRGSFDAEPFDVFIEADARIRRHLAPVFVVPDGEAGSFNLTVLVDVASWFRRDDGSLIDPRDAHLRGPAEDLVAERIERSFDVFSDRDRRGRRGAG